jgi:hypothetical protein
MVRRRIFASRSGSSRPGASRLPTPTRATVTRAGRPKTQTDRPRCPSWPRGPSTEQPSTRPEPALRRAQRDLARRQHRRRQLICRDLARRRDQVREHVYDPVRDPSRRRRFTEMVRMTKREDSHRRLSGLVHNRYYHRRFSRLASWISPGDHRRGSRGGDSTWRLAEDMTRFGRRRARKRRRPRECRGRQSISLLLRGRHSPTSSNRCAADLTDRVGGHGGLTARPLAALNHREDERAPAPQ